MQIFRLATAPIKICQIPHVIFGTKSRFFLKFLITLQCHEAYLLWTFSSKTLYALDKRSPSKYKFPSFWLLAWKLTNFLMSFFKPRASFSLKFCITPQCHDTLFLWNFLTETLHALDKKSPMKYIFQTFECSNNSSPNSWCHFWNHRVRIYSNFAYLFSAMKDNSSDFL